MDIVVFFGLRGRAAWCHVAGVRSWIRRTLGLIFHAVGIVRSFAKLSYQLQVSKQLFKSCTHSSLWFSLPFNVNIQPKKWQSVVSTNSTPTRKSPLKILSWCWACKIRPTYSIVYVYLYPQIWRNDWIFKKIFLIFFILPHSRYKIQCLRNWN